MGQERSECRGCRNRHCRQQKQMASKGHCKLFSVCQKKLRSKNGMTLTELLAAIVILGMIGTVLGGGVMMVKNVYQRTQDQADAEQALSLTAQLMTDEFANALEVKNSAGTSETGEMVTPLLRSGNSHLWLHFSATDWSGTGMNRHFFFVFFIFFHGIYLSYRMQPRPRHRRHHSGYLPHPEEHPRWLRTHPEYQ